MTAIHDQVPLLHDYILHSGRTLPDKVALVCGKARVTYGQINERSNALAHTLIEVGVTPGDRVFVFADNTVEAVISFWAALKANAVVCIINPLSKADKLGYLIGDCTPSVLISDAHLFSAWEESSQSPHLKCTIVTGTLAEEKLSKVPNGLEWADALSRGKTSSPPNRTRIDIDLAAIIYTSGSTGKPKGVMLTHRNMLTAATSVSGYLDLQEDEIILGVLPLAFDYGLYQMIMAFRMGARVVLERSFTFPAQVLKVMVQEKVTCLPIVPTIVAILAEMKDLGDMDFSPVRVVTNTAASLPVKHIRMLRDLMPGARIYSMYGLTECKRCTYLPPADLDRKPTSVGIAIPNTELWIVDDAGERVGPNTLGQLVIRGATVMKGYWNKPEATAKKLKPGPLPGEQVLYTGDFCKLDDDGYLYFVSRMDDIIKCRGEKVSPKEVEDVLVNIPGVREAAVIGIPDSILGQAVKAFVSLEQGIEISEKEIRRECQARLENFMIPKTVEFVNELPRTSSGKVKKTGLS